MTKATHSIAHVEERHIRWFVLGYFMEHMRNTGTGGRPGDQWPGSAYFHETMVRVLAYMQGQVGLDASFSDMQVDVALKAKKLFKPVPLTIEGGVCEKCGGPNMAHMAGGCQ